LLCCFWLALAQAPAVREVPGTAALVLGGTALSGGIGLRIMAIRTLGAEFVSEHRASRLVTSGVYGILRHPSETGQLLLALGVTLLLCSSWSAAWLMAVILPLTLWRLRQEEAVLMDQLGGYAAYRHQVDGLVPLRLLGRAMRDVIRG
jgi:protein-S-isoprenylcysteine O-methyltransferase Ste14